MTYGRKKKKSAMCAKFNDDGTKIFVLGRKSNPLLYDLSSPLPIAEFDHPGYWNRCTMKSGTFGRNYVFSGSDNFAIYAWQIPDFCSSESGFQYIKRADFVLQGHQSIVNQVRFNPIYNVLASSGVEKRIKCWSPFDIGSTSEEISKNRRISRVENRFQLYTQSTELTENFDTESTEENPKMLAFFDTLVQRDFSSDSEETLSDTESDDIESVIAKKRLKRTKSRLSSQDSDYVQNAIQSAKDVLNESEEPKPENLLNFETDSELDSDVERAILDLDKSSDEENSEAKQTKSESSESEHEQQEPQRNNNVFKKGKKGKVRCYRSNK